MSSILRVQVFVSFLLLGSAGCSRCGSDRARGAAGAEPVVAARAEVLAELGAADDTGDGAEFAFAELGGGVAWVAREGEGHVVKHGGRAGKRYAEVGEVVLSPDGRRVAHAARVGGAWCVVVDGVEGRRFDEVETPAFSRDGRHVLYQARDGGRWHLVVDAAMNGGAEARYAWYAFGLGASRVVFVEGADAQGFGALVVAELAFERPVTALPRAARVVLSQRGDTVAAVVPAQDGQAVVKLRLDAPEQFTQYGPFDAVDVLAFAPAGDAVAAIAQRAGARVVVLEGREQAIPAGDEPVAPPVVRPDGHAVGVVVIADGEVHLRQVFAMPPARPPPADGIYELEYAPDGSHAYAAEKDGRWHVVVNGREGPAFDRVVSPAFSPDGSRVVYRARREGRRFVVVATATGEVLREDPAYEQVFPVRFTADGRSIAYGVKDGRRLAWKVEPLQRP